MDGGQIRIITDCFLDYTSSVIFTYLGKDDNKEISINHIVRVIISRRIR